MLSRNHRMIVAALAACAFALPAAAQTGHSTHPAPGARHGGMHGTGSPHPTPKRQHMMEQMHRAQGARHHGTAQNTETDRLNSQSLQRVQQGDGAAPAGPGLTGSAPGVNQIAPAR